MIKLGKKSLSLLMAGGMLLVAGQVMPITSMEQKYRTADSLFTVMIPLYRLMDTQLITTMPVLNGPGSHQMFLS